MSDMAASSPTNGPGHDPTDFPVEDETHFLTALGINVKLPEHDLLVAIIQRACMDYAGAALTPQHIRRNAASWLFSKKKRKWTYAWMLGQLSDEPHDLRAKIARGLKAMRERMPEVREARRKTSAAPADVVRSPDDETNAHADRPPRLPESGDGPTFEEGRQRLPNEALAGHRRDADGHIRVPEAPGSHPGVEGAGVRGEVRDTEGNVPGGVAGDAGAE